MAGWINRFRGISRELLIFSTAYFVMGIAFSMMDSTFNNFLNERFALTGFQRSFLELPRELPGFLVVFVSALLSFLCSRRLGFVALLMGAVGALLIGFVSSSYAVMTLWLFLYSMGNHLLIPIASTIGLELAREGRAGQRLGQLNAVRNLAMVLGSFLVVLGFRYLGFSFQFVFLMVSIGLVISALLFYQWKPEPQKAVRAITFLTLDRSYRLY